MESGEMDKHDALLVINAGSSSVKCKVFSLADLSVLEEIKIGRIGENGAEFPSHEKAFGYILEKTKNFSIKAAAHRVVHGGPLYSETVRVEAKDIETLRGFSGFAPLHQPHNLGAIEILLKLQPELPNYAAFDTGFHAGHNPVFDAYALPENLRAKGIRKYGFHGLSYKYICSALQTDRPEIYKGKTVIAHLGNGSSLCAVENGKSIDTTMGMTVLDGLPMGTRCGSIDPGVVLYLGTEGGLSSEDLFYTLYYKSGLLGLSNISNDVKTLLESADPQAAFAIDYYVHKVVQNICMMAASLGGMDALVFTGGIGENADSIRKSVLDRLKFMPEFETLVIPTNEELTIARDAKEIIKSEQTTELPDRRQLSASAHTGR